MTRYWRVLSLIVALLAVAKADDPADILAVPELTDPVTVDGRLDEPCYKTTPPLQRFVDVAQPTAKRPATRAWVFWAPERLTVAFDCDDATPAAAASTANETDVDPQDRVELFLWSGRSDDPYYCLEIAAKGAVHDYQARFYRKFDDSWKPTGFTTKVADTATGYTVEATLDAAGLKAIGFPLATGRTWRAGLFRADFDKLGGTPTWLSWVNPKTPEPDFHVATAFGTFDLRPRRH